MGCHKCPPAKPETLQNAGRAAASAIQCSGNAGSDGQCFLGGTCGGRPRAACFSALGAFPGHNRCKPANPCKPVTSTRIVTAQHLVDMSCTLQHGSSSDLVSAHQGDRACTRAGVGQGTLGAQSNHLPQSLGQYGSSYAQSPLASSATAPLVGPQQPNSYRSGDRAQSTMHVAGLHSSKPNQDASRAGANPLNSLPDISAEELPLKYVDREKLELSTERLKVRLPPLCLACSLSCDQNQFCLR